MSTYLRKFQTLSELNAEKVAGTLACPNTALVMADGSVHYTHELVTEDIGIRGANGVCYSLAQWNALAASDKPTPVGVYIYDQEKGTGIILHSTVNSSVQWSNNISVAFSDVVTTTNAAAAIADMEGKANTAAIIAGAAVAGATCPAATWAKGLSWAESGLEGYLPAAGEVELVRLNLAAVNACRSAIGQSEIVFQGKYIWSSTQYSTYYAWYWYSTYWYFSNKYLSYCALAVAAF